MSESGKKQNKPGPLDGVKVVEYGVFHAGPGGGAILGDLGAEVIKIEAGIGDPERYWTHVAGIDMSAPNGESLMHEVSNRNKKGIYLDISKEKGREILHQLIKDADVFLTNLRKSTKKKIGIDYQTVSKVNPKIIHANVSGYGPEGPMSDLGAFDPLGQARSGMMFVTGNPEPTLLHLGVLDQTTAIAASHAIITALLVKERKGIGQEVHVSLYSTALWMQHPNLMLSNAISVNPCVTSSRTEHSPLRNAFCCKDGKWILGTHHPEEKYWTLFCNATGQKQILNDPTFTDKHRKPLNFPELIEVFDKVFATKTRDEWMEIFQKNKLMFSSVQQIHEVENDEQAIVNNYVEPFDYPGIGKINVPGYPIQFSECSAGIKHNAPSIGEHTDQILIDLGYSGEDIKKLRREEIIK
ncbi:MAG: CoA transferase [Deltaproteobacteria bacterium]|nr:CoA transferase [Deltaproteobacteria bacterium]